MNNFEYGFLSEYYAEAVQDEVRARYGNWRSLLMRVTASAVAAQYELAVHIEDRRELFAAALYARTISSCQGAVVLLEHGMIAQARCVLRSALETLFSLAAIAEKPELALRLAQAHDVERKRAATNILRWKHPALQAIAKSELETGNLDAVLISEPASISTFDLAEAGGFEDWYRSLYMVLSWSVHGAAADLERHFAQDTSGAIHQMSNEPEVISQELCWLVAIEVQIKAARSLAKVFGTPIDTKYDQYEKELSALEASVL